MFDEFFFCACLCAPLVAGSSFRDRRNLSNLSSGHWSAETTLLSSHARIRMRLVGSSLMLHKAIALCPKDCKLEDSARCSDCTDN